MRNNVALPKHIPQVSNNRSAVMNKNYLLGCFFSSCKELSCCWGRNPCLVIIWELIILAPNGSNQTENVHVHCKEMSISGIKTICEGAEGGAGKTELRRHAPLFALRVLHRVVGWCSILWGGATRLLKWVSSSKPLKTLLIREKPYFGLWCDWM